MRMRPFGKLLGVAEALARLDRATHPVRSVEEVGVLQGVGRVVARDYRAVADVPAFARATWDGFAVRSRDTRGAALSSPVRLRVVAEIYAEESLRRPLGPGEAAAIATGAAVPRGADAIAIVEDVKVERTTVVLSTPVSRGDRVAEPGDDFRRGTRLVSAGSVLGPAELGALAATGASRVRVYRRPVVTVIPNGNELVSPGRRLGRGRIYESNNAALAALLLASGAEPRSVPPIPDDPGRIETAIRKALHESDAVIVTGGSSVGDHDYLPRIFPRIGTLLFHGIAVRPGKPTLAARVGSRLLIGMPGHPTSCLSNGLWLLLPTLRKLARLPGPGWVEGTVRLAEPITRTSATFSIVVPMRVEGGSAHLTFKDSSAITSMSGVNAYALRPPGARELPRGARLLVRLLLPPLAVP